MATSKDESARDEVAASGLETRRTHKVPPTPEDIGQPIDQDREPDAADPNLAVYLIEREAIQLRRARWTALTEMAPQPAAGEGMDRASRHGGIAASERLTPYMRPEPPSSRSKPASDLGSRVQRWLRQIFSGE